MEPIYNLNWYAVVAVVAVNFFLGMFWYAPWLFGRRWRLEIGKSEDYQPAGRTLGRAIALNLGGAFLTAFVLATIFAMFTPDTWLHDGQGLQWHEGLVGGFFVWLGFFVPLLLWLVGWEGKTWRWASIHAGYHLGYLLIGGLILAVW